MAAKDIRTAINDLVQERGLSDRAAALLLVELATQYLSRVRAGADSSGSYYSAAEDLNNAYCWIQDGR